MAEPKMRVKTICVYPIKSFGGCTLPRMKATAAGFDHDRRFMLERVSDSKAMAVGKMYEMCLFTTELSPASNPDTILVRYTLDHVFDRPEDKLDDGDPKVLEVPLEPDWKKDKLKEREVVMHNSPTYGYEMAEHYNDWLSRRFGYAVRLLYVGENRRPVLGSVTPKAKAVTNSPAGWLGSVSSWVSNVYTGRDSETYEGVDQGIGFADVAPFLVVNQKSYENAAARLGESADLDILKFRPNIIVEGSSSDFEEDYWAELAITHNDTADGDTEARLVLTSNCARCASINVDFDTGRQGTGEEGKILKALQKDRRVDPGMKYSPIFGRYGFLARKGSVAEDGEVEICVGDEVSVVRRNEERTRFQWPGISTDN